jgi:hypothetical protein
VTSGILTISAYSIKYQGKNLRLNARDESILLFLALQKNRGVEPVPIAEFINLRQFQKFENPDTDKSAKLSRALYTRVFERNEKFGKENENAEYAPIFEYVRSGNTPAMQLQVGIQVEILDEDWVIERLGLSQAMVLSIDDLKDPEALIINAIAHIHRGKLKEGKEILEQVNRLENLSLETRIVAMAQTAYLLESFSLDAAEGALVRLEKLLEPLFSGEKLESGEIFSETRIKEFKATVALRWGRLAVYRYNSEEAANKLCESIEILLYPSQKNLAQNQGETPEWQKDYELRNADLIEKIESKGIVDETEETRIFNTLTKINTIFSKATIWGTINPLMMASSLVVLGENLVQSRYEIDKNNNDEYVQFERSGIEIQWGIKALEIALNFYHCTQYTRGVNRAFSLLAWANLIYLEQEYKRPTRDKDGKLLDDYSQKWIEIEKIIKKAEKFVINAHNLSSIRAREDASCYEELGYSQIYHYQGMYNPNVEEAQRALDLAGEWLEKARRMAIKVGNLRQIGTVYRAFARLSQAKYEISKSDTDWKNFLDYTKLSAEQANKAVQARRYGWLTQVIAKTKSLQKIHPL